MDRLSQGPASHGGKKHVIQLLDHFRHEGPNGMHLCLVLELLGPSILSKAESYSTNRLPGDIAWEASKQIVHGLTYIHALGIVHGGQLDICILALILLNVTRLRPTSGQYSLCKYSARHGPPHVSWKAANR